MFGADGQAIVVGADDSVGGRAAVTWAAEEAHRRQVPLDVVHAWHPMPHAHVDDFTVGRLPAAHQSHGEEVLARALSTIHNDQPGVRVSGHLMRGNAAVALLDASRAASMVVIGSRGLGGFTGLLLGSVGTHVVAHATCPVVIVRGSLHRSGPVTVGIDGSEASSPVMAAAFEAAATRHAPLVVISAVDEECETAGTALRVGTDHDQQVSRHIEDLVASLSQKYPQISVTTSLPTTHPAEALLAASRTAQLLVIGSHGSGGFAGMAIGSIAQAVVHHAHCPVVVYRERPALREATELSRAVAAVNE